MNYIINYICYNECTTTNKIKIYNYCNNMKFEKDKSLEISFLLIIIHKANNNIIISLKIL